MSAPVTPEVDTVGLMAQVAPEGEGLLSGYPEVDRRHAEVGELPVIDTEPSFPFPGRVEP
jgi:hypothetical protein